MRIFGYIFLLLIVSTSCSEKKAVNQTDTSAFHGEKMPSPSNNNLKEVPDEPAVPDTSQCNGILSIYKNCSFDIKDPKVFIRTCESLAKNQPENFRKALKIIISRECSSIIRDISKAQKTDLPLYDFFQKLQKNPDGGKNCPL
ncbi:hypothetical protein KKF34_17365 [Myxococcota bacterium]|nr:hypothetical protein [Myxococcota bacterium]MBU1382969.1 hypothetical protein [Myxococcota bacterium]MBU1498651.1 hypothetical protein [Myxococcota bacterium]